VTVVTLTNSTLTDNKAIGGTGTGVVTAYANMGLGSGIDNLDGEIFTIINSLCQYPSSGPSLE